MSPRDSASSVDHSAAIAERYSAESAAAAAATMAVASNVIEQ